MDYFFAALGGGAFGAIVGLAKYLFLWAPEINGKKQFTQESVTAKLIIQNFINVATLLTVYFLRNIWPYPFLITIFATAIALSLMSRFTFLRQNKQSAIIGSQTASHNNDDKTVKFKK